MKQKINLVYLGKKGAGPKLTLDFYNAFRKRVDLDTGIIISDANSLSDDYVKNETQYSNNNLTILPLGANAVELLLSFIPFVIEFAKLVVRNKSKSHASINKYLFTMLHPFNFICMIIINILDGNAKVITIVHDATPHPGDRSALLNSILTSIEINFANYVATLSEDVASILKAKYSNTNFITFPHGVFDYGFVVKPKSIVASQKIKILAIGRIVKYKGFELLIKAYNNLLQSGYNVELTIAGDGPIYDLVSKSEIDKLKINIDNKYLTDDDIKKYLESADILALSYIEASQSGVLALACSKALPVVATPVGGLIEQCDMMGNAVLAESVSPEGFSTAIKSLIDSPELYTKLSSSSISAQDKVSWRIGVDVISGI